MINLLSFSNLRRYIFNFVVEPSAGFTLKPALRGPASFQGVSSLGRSSRCGFGRCRNFKMTRAIRWVCTDSTAFCRQTKARFCFYEERKPSRSSAGFGDNLRWKLGKVRCQILEKVRAVWRLCGGQFQVLIWVPE